MVETLDLNPPQRAPINRRSTTAPRGSATGTEQSFGPIWWYPPFEDGAEQSLTWRPPTPFDDGAEQSFIYNFFPFEDGAE